MTPIYFRTPTAFRAWLKTHHATAAECWVGYFKKGSGTASITWPESVDEALCYGWIDGIRKSVDALRYTIRFTPRKRGSVWSSINIARAQALIADGRMRPSGLAAYEVRKDDRSGVYSYEQRMVELEEPYRALLRKNRAAWEFYQAQPASYRKAANWWVVSAKKEETRLRRVEKLVTLAIEGRRLPGLTPRKPPAVASGTGRARRDGSNTDEVDAWMAALEHPLKAEIEAIRVLIRGADRRIRESVKWNAPSYAIEDHFATLHVRRAGEILVILHRGGRPKLKKATPTLTDPRGLVTWAAKDRGVVSFSSMSEIRSRRAAFLAILAEWIRQL